MTRGPDYAYRLSRAERRTLGRLRDQLTVTGPGAPARTPVSYPVPDGPAGWPRLRLVLVAVAVASIGLFSTLVPGLHRPGPPSAPATIASSPSSPSPSPSPSTVDILTRLSAAAGSVGGTAPPKSSIMTMAADRAQLDCPYEFTMYASAVVKPGTTSRPPLSVLVTVGVAPSGTPAWIPCPASSAGGSVSVDKPVLTETVDDHKVTWKLVEGQLADRGLSVPELDDPRQLADSIEVSDIGSPRVVGPVLDQATTQVEQSASAAAWWTAVTRLTASFLCPPAVRVAALALAADPAHAADVELVRSPPTDVLGRPGVTIRVPYLLTRQVTTADLTFSPETGALLQRTVRVPDGQRWSVVVTAFGV